MPPTPLATSVNALGLLLLLGLDGLAAVLDTPLDTQLEEGADPVDDYRARRRAVPCRGKRSIPVADAPLPDRRQERPRSLGPSAGGGSTYSATACGSTAVGTRSSFSCGGTAAATGSSPVPAEPPLLLPQTASSAPPLPPPAPVPAASTVASPTTAIAARSSFSTGMRQAGPATCRQPRYSGAHWVIAQRGPARSI
jgi:hypothetical protein